MSSTKCEGCGNTIDISVDRCPYCGALNQQLAAAAEERWLPAWTQGIASGGFSNGSYDIVDYPAMPFSQAMTILKTLPIPPQVPDPGDYCPPAIGFDERHVARYDNGQYFLWPENRFCTLEEAIQVLKQIYGYPG